jgi:hypothetical protein
MPSPQDPWAKGQKQDHLRESESDIELDECRPRIFTFISNQDKCGSRKLARSHVAREIWEQKRRSYEETRTGEVPGELVWRFKKKKTVVKTARKKATGKSLTLCPMAIVPGTAGVNPFPNYDLNYGGNTEELLHHCMRPVARLKN